MKFLIETVVIFLIVLTIFVIIPATSSYKAKKEFQQEAVRVGHAKFVATDEGDVEFKWLATNTAEVSN
jgi:hypothetical protein